MRTSRNYVRLCKVPLERVTAALLKGDATLDLENMALVDISSDRMRTYMKGTNCVHCGREGHYFAAEKIRDKDPWHLNLYHLKSDGQETMLTSDHIISKFNGGGDGLNNRQPLCSPCNSRKGRYNSIEEAKSYKAIEIVLGLPSKIRKAEKSIQICLKKIQEGNTSKDWLRFIRMHEERVRKCKLQLLTAANCSTNQEGNMNDISKKVEMPTVKFATGATKYILQGNMVKPTSEAALNLQDQLPVGNWMVKFNEREGYFYYERIDGFSLPSKLYGDTTRNADRILTTYQDRSASTGVLLTGEKGSGKTLLAKVLAVRAAELGWPTIVINTAYYGDLFNAFMQSLHQPCIVFFDEFEKTYEKKESQEGTLTLLDGVFPSKKLFIFTVNNKWSLNDFLTNRPGRIFYSIGYDTLSTAFVEEYCKDNLDNKEHIGLVCQAAGLFSKFNFDILKALVEDMNRYKETPQQVLQFLNASPENESSSPRKFDVAIRMPNGEVLGADRLRDSTIRINPLRHTGFHICMLSPQSSAEAKEGGNDSIESIINSISSDDDRDEIYEEFSSNSLISMDGTKGEFVFKSKKNLLCVLTASPVETKSYISYMS